MMNNLSFVFPERSSKERYCKNHNSLYSKDIIILYITVQLQLMTPTLFRQVPYAPEQL